MIQYTILFVVLIALASANNMESMYPEISECSHEDIIGLIKWFVCENSDVEEIPFGVKCCYDTLDIFIGVLRRNPSNMGLLRNILFLDQAHHGRIAAIIYSEEFHTMSKYRVEKSAEAIKYVRNIVNKTTSSFCDADYQFISKYGDRSYMTCDDKLCFYIVSGFSDHYVRIIY